MGLLGFLRQPLRKSFDGKLARTLSRVSAYCDEVLYIENEIRGGIPDDGLLLKMLRCPSKRSFSSLEKLLPELDGSDRLSLILLNGTLNHSLDIEGYLASIQARMNRQSRIALIAYNPYLKLVYSIVNLLGMRRGELPTTFLTHTDLSNLAKLAGLEVVRVLPRVYIPVPLLALERLLEAVLPMVPGLRQLCMTNVILLRPIKPETHAPSLSVVIPARNEKGNIQPAIDRLGSWKLCPLEIVFVEGHSSDGTWEEIQRAIREYRGPILLQAHRQTGKGKADAVRLGMERATADLLAILDADLTMPPEMLPRFYQAYVRGHADFINGSRLVYPLADGAMRFLNRLGNVFFAKALGFVLSAKIGDSLCGTKLVSRRDYERFRRWRQKFGDFDPFGDFELIFPAAILGLGIVDVPVHYLARTYGETQIHRFQHGFQLLRMTLIGFFRIKLRG